MPGKGKHGKKKFALQGKVKETPKQSAPITGTSQTTAVTPQPTAAAATRIKTPKAAAARYPYITSELKRIGILTGIIFIILIILAIVLP